MKLIFDTLELEFMQDLTFAIEDLLGVTTSDAQAIMEAQEGLAEKAFADGLSPEEAAELF